jgi:membrane protein YdbS with pleckstrin-like domain
MLTAVILILALSNDKAIKFAVGLQVGACVVLSFALCFSYHERLRKASYIVTSECIEAQTGTLGKSVRRIPMSYIRDVTLSQNLLQRPFDTFNLTVTATNGDKIVLENVKEGERKQEIIWELVLAKSSNASRSRNVHQ